MKKLHLLCNAHLDPAWIWRRNEGLAEAISTFRVAADFCEKYDGFVFNHNEALLYEWIEEHEPALFERIKKLVSEDKWVIMGGWYLQPDCVMTSGESLLTQIELGREYFKEKFGKSPTTAINFDPFGHSRGLVQILKKCGYDSYIFMRPETIKGDFLWEGFDGSRVIAHGMFDVYSTVKGQALDKVKRCIDTEIKDTGLCLWGVGNHGGGPSRIDLEAINAFASESDTEIIHSSAEDYIKEVDKDSLKVYSKSLWSNQVGCYTSMARIKQANRRLEGKIAMTEKIMAYADMETDFSFDCDELMKAKKALAYCQFHDILPGSSIKPVEDDSLATFGYAEEIVDRLFIKAFFKLCQGQDKTPEGEIPVMIFNPHPYEVTGEFSVEFTLPAQNRNFAETTLATVYDSNGNPLPTQNEKPECTFNMDWVKKIVFRATVAPSGITRFNCKLRRVPAASVILPEHTGDTIDIQNDRMSVSISKRTGLIEKYAVDGKSRIVRGGAIEVYRDDEDPWGMMVDSFADLEGQFRLMTDEEANEFNGYPDSRVPNVHIVEDGEVQTKIQALFSYKRSVALAEYTVPKAGNYIDCRIVLYSNEPNKMIKYVIDTDMCGTSWGETAFGSEEHYSDGKECVFHKWCGIKGDEAKLYVINKGTYGGSFTPESIKLSLLRTSVYACHPIDDRQLAPHDRHIDHIDMGRREFFFRITTDEDICTKAQIYNEEPFALSFFPSGDGRKKPSSPVILSDKSIILSGISKKDGVYKLNLYNSSELPGEVTLTLPGENKKLDLSFGKHELKMINV